MNEKEIILEAMKKAGEPLNAGKVAELTGLDRKVVDKADAAAMRASLFAKRNRLWSNKMADTKTMRIDEVPRLEDQFCFPLYACVKEVVRQYRKPLEALNLTYTQYLVMMVLWEHGGMTEGQLGRKVYLDSGTLAPLLKRMERSGTLSADTGKRGSRTWRKQGQRGIS